RPTPSPSCRGCPRRGASRRGCTPRQTPSPCAPGTSWPFGGTVRARGGTPRSAAMIPGYEILDELGRGGMGVVYKARPTCDGRLVAVKTVLPAVAPRAETLGRFRREMEILGRLAHPNVVAFFETGESGLLLYFVMEYVDGLSAALLVKR